VTHQTTTYSILARRVDHFEHAVVLRCGIDPTRALDWCLACLVLVASRIRHRIGRDGVGFLLDHCVRMAVDSRIGTVREDVLMVLSLHGSKHHKRLAVWSDLLVGGLVVYRLPVPWESICREMVLSVF
jgi:hypothetical protein